MMSRDDVAEALRDALVIRGFSGRGRNLRVIRVEVAWLVQIELIPRTERVGLYLGVCPAVLAPDGWPRRANNCPIIVDPASGGALLLGHDRWEAWQALDVDSGLTDDMRRESLDRLAEKIGSATLRITTLVDLRAAAASGQFTGFVHKDARALLEAG